jgi:hypothetical protein
MSRKCIFGDIIPLLVSYATGNRRIYVLLLGLRR